MISSKFESEMDLIKLNYVINVQMQGFQLNSKKFRSFNLMDFEQKYSLLKDLKS